MTDRDRIDLDGLTTEARNPRSRNLDAMSSLEIVQLINSEDRLVAEAVAAEADPISRAIDVIADRMSRSGRLVYVGAGTSGRLGVLDAAECEPTFNTAPEQVIGLIAGGEEALLHAVEGAEDDPGLGADDLRNIGLGERDVVVGIAASGRTPYVLGALDHAREVGAAAIGFSCNAAAELRGHADFSIIPVVGPEVLTGSTRMKAGTATKMVLNMLTTGTMVRLGKTYGNLMVDLQAKNRKLVERSVNIVMMLTDCSRERALELLEACGGEVKTAVLAQLAALSAGAARAELQAADGHLRAALDAIGGRGGDPDGLE